jgi:AraC-like DNA-binding protein
MSFSLVNVLSIIIVFQLALLVLFLLTVRRGKFISNLLLASFFFLLLLNIIDGLLSYYGFYVGYPGLAHLEDGFVFLLGPVLYFYTRSVVFRNFAFQRKDLLHILPFIIVTVSYQIFYRFQTEAYQKMIQGSIMHQTLPPAFYISTLFIYGHVCAYILAAFRELNFYRREIKQQFSSISKINLEWLTFLLLSVLTILFISIVYTFLPIAGLSQFFEFGFALAFLFVFVFISGVVWRALKQPAIFSGIDRDDNTGSKYQSSTLSDQEKNSLVSALNQKMEVEKIFLNPELSLDMLAAIVGVSGKKLSQVINEKFQQNFFDYINSCRIEEAKNIFDKSNDPKLTVLEVMYQCGFNSKSSFNTIFKAKTGLTPSAYKRNNSLLKRSTLE